MGILSLFTEVVFGVVALTAFVVLLIFWHKLSVHNFRNIFIRVSAILFINIFVLSAIGIGLNRYGDFYSSWSDLVGIQQNYKSVAIAPKDVALVTQHQIDRADKTADGALIFKEVITGENSKVSNFVYVAASPSVVKVLKEGKPLSSISNYQVEELFSGYPGVPQTWIGSLGAIHTMSQLDLAGQIPPTIAVIPDINIIPHEDTECLNIPNVADVETWITGDMYSFMQKFIGIDSRQWSVFGYSTGGWCAAEVAMRHPDMYKNAVVLAGYFQPQFATKVEKKTRALLSTQYDLISLAKNQFNNPPMMIIYSTQDRGSFREMKYFTSAVKGYVSTPIITIPQGGHNIQVWKPYVGSALLWSATGKIKLQTA
jgi:hypothetical protein